MTTITAPRSASTPAWWATARRLFGAAAPAEADAARLEDVATLLERAAQYAPTQPGYAADLRAAARRLLDAR